MTTFNCVLIGAESLLIGCGDQLRARGHTIAAVVSPNPDIREWASKHAIPTLERMADLEAACPAGSFEWLLSIANLTLLPDNILALPSKGAVNFHDGPLPEVAGLNTPAWARITNAPQHGITWHFMESGIDTGDILEKRLFDIASSDTAFSLNSKCYAAAMDSFPPLLDQLETGLKRTPQDPSGRRYFSRNQRPENDGFINPSAPVSDALALIRGLDFGGYANPLTRAKLNTGVMPLLIASAEQTEGTGAPGTVLSVDKDSISLACLDGAIQLNGLTDPLGQNTVLSDIVSVGSILPPVDPAIGPAMATLAADDSYWRRRLAAATPLALPLARSIHTAARWQSLPVALPPMDDDTRLAVLAQWARLSSGQREGEFGYSSKALGALVDAAPNLVATTAMIRVGDGDLDATRAALAPQIARLDKTPGFARDLFTRDPAIGFARPGIAISESGPIFGTALTLELGDPCTLHWDETRLSETSIQMLTARLEHLADAALHDRPLNTLPDSERDTLLNTWNATDTGYDRTQTVHSLFEAQVARTPDAPALVFEGETLSYTALNARANQVAHALSALGVAPGSHVGLCVPRSADLLIGALGILKAGGAYVPLDPAYPADRIAHYIKDSQISVILAAPELAHDLPKGNAQILTTDDPSITAAPDASINGGASPEDLAYLIYTSGSTGLPKGVMVEHRNVANFFVGMDQRIDHDTGAVWLAVTSLSFDISVLELFWTLARGFKLVLSSDENRTLVSGDAPARSDRHIDFNLFYWGNDDGVGAKKYKLLLEGAKFADAHGFNAVWTPERHFHAFGGPYPNPSVTGAAVAAVTQNLSVRAGSCVAPLHHPARIAEEWAVIDNLTDGRAGIAIASGWQPDDFVLRPENTPPANKPAMFEAIETLRKLWRGDAVEFPTKDGTPFAVVTQPRPVSKELPIWVTTAGNPETWKEAGSIGANVLTHLLGQSIDEVAGKITLYHDALRAAGHDPAHHRVTVMLHTYLADSRAEAEEVAREPMKDYLRSAAGLIKQYAWAFPAFKRPKGVTNPFEVDLESLTPEEMDAILDFAFQRYFEDSGLFGTIDDAVARAEKLKRIGVDEIACLIDYGIAPDVVMEGLKPLATALQRANADTAPAEDDFSIAAQIRRHRVTHLQCTPSMARMITMNDDARMALSHLKTMMIGGEALSGDLVTSVRGATSATILNMYGPTETTIWSTVQKVGETPHDIQPIGTPIANTSVYVVDPAGNPAPIGVAGELFIAGEGVTRGYWQRPELTAERFPPDPFRAGRMYATGDLAAWRADGTLDFLGRGDHQVKIRGHRIELGEIEARLAEHPEVSQAVVIARDMGGDTRLVAYVTVAQTLDTATLRAYLIDVLPAIMVPAHIVTLERFPLTPNRKVDRNALPMPQPTVRAAPPPAVSNDGASTEQAIAAVWQRILGVSGINSADNFFALGGHSLLAVQAHRELREALNAPKLSITDIFRFPTLGALSAHVGKTTTQGTTKPDDASQASAISPQQTDPARAETMSRRRAMRAGRGAKIE